jgi:hypothetical protein
MAVARKTKTLSLVKGRRMRATRLDGCGRPVYGDESTVVSRGFISVAFTANTSESDEINVTNAAGETCVAEASEVTLSGYGVEITFCEVDPELFSLFTGQPVLRDAFGQVIGLDIDTSIRLDNSGVALELWAGAPSGDACAPGAAAAQGQFGYLLLPFLQGGILGDFTVENAAITFTLTGANTRNGGSWGKGPYDVMVNPGANGGEPFLGPMLEPVSPTTALRLLLVDVAPPAAYAGARPLMDAGAGTGLTSVTAAVTGTVATISVLPDAAVDEPIWYDFGDGTWDYVAGAGGDTEHDYEKAGSYTLWAFNGAGEPVTATVTIA